jgi:hypothetical protein
MIIVALVTQGGGEYALPWAMILCPCRAIPRKAKRAVHGAEQYRNLRVKGKWDYLYPYYV